MSRALRFAVVAVAGLLVVLVLGAVSTLRSEERSPEPATSSSASAAPRPNPVGLLLLQVSDASDYAPVNAVIGSAAGPQFTRTTVLEIPPSLLVPVDGTRIALGMTPEEPDTLAGVKGVRGELLLDVDASLTVDRLAFAGWVDGVDGIWLFLDDSLVLGGRDAVVRAGDAPRTVGPGWTRLDGPTAADYLLTPIPGESALARARRNAEVIEAAISRMPETPERLRHLVTSLGSLARPTVPTDDLVPFLLQVRADIRFGRVERAVLPVDVIRGGERGAAVPAPRAWVMLERLFPDSRITAEEGVTG